MNNLPDLPLRMVIKDLAASPTYTLPEGFHFAWYENGFERDWLDIHVKADKLNTFKADTFERQFGHDEALLHQRQCYLVNAADAKVGTATAWFDEEYADGRYGRVHWVAISPEVQGNQLAKPLISAVCQRLISLGHEKAYLNTSTGRIPALNLYLHFGFEPDIQSDQDVQNWRLVRDHLKYPIQIPG